MAGSPIGWAVRIASAWAAIAVVAGVYHSLPASLQSRRLDRSAVAPRSVPANTVVYSADPLGHVTIEASVNGAPIRFLLDTGASLVALPPEAAEAAGIDPSELAFDQQAATANGVARVAPVTLREIRIDQLTVENVPAVVIEKLRVPLLGMSFLTRLKSYEMRDGELIVRY